MTRESLAVLLLTMLPSFSGAFFTPPQLPPSRVTANTIAASQMSTRCRHRPESGTSSCLLFAFKSDDDNEPSVDETHASADAIFGMVDADADGSMSCSEL